MHNIASVTTENKAGADDTKQRRKIVTKKNADRKVEESKQSEVRI